MSLPSVTRRLHLEGTTLAIKLEPAELPRPNTDSSNSRSRSRSELPLILYLTHSSTLTNSAHKPNSGPANPNLESCSRVILQHSTCRRPCPLLSLGLPAQRSSSRAAKRLLAQHTQSTRSHCLPQLKRHWPPKPDQIYSIASASKRR